jgi:hypothetical protein
VSIAIGASAGLAAFDEVPLRLCRLGNGITALALISLITLRAVRDEGDRDARLGGSDSHVWNSIRRRAEVGMQAAIAPDEIDERI